MKVTYDKKPVVFLKGLHSSNWKNRAKALEKLALDNGKQHPNQLFPVLFASLYDQEPGVRMIAVHYLAKYIPNNMTANYIKELLEAEEAQIRTSALIAAETICSSYLIPIFENHKENDPILQKKIQSLLNYLK